MKSLVPSLIIGGSAVFIGTMQAVPQQGPERASRPGASAEAIAAAETYEHLATAIIELDAAEDTLVKTILIGYASSARRHLGAASAGRGDVRAHLEAAAAEIANVANEGDARIRAVRQRLLQAGITHNTDESTQEDYMFIDSQEKKEFLDLARKVGQTSPDAGPEEIRALAEEFDGLVAGAMAGE